MSLLVMLIADHIHNNACFKGDRQSAFAGTDISSRFDLGNAEEDRWQRDMLLDVRPEADQLNS
ncbi:hypothetical protein [Pseudomonas sp. PAMC 29040]|uniref:hypothetical protein n=1 Tax=Pseudomonas sp. PAMC 29040 TaxID=2498450 RepID=UPI001404F868|nr:hypothetical protein [Pseudomonas sp. PAMC 29040]